MEDWASHALDRLLSAMSGEGVLGVTAAALRQAVADHPQRRLAPVAFPAGGVRLPHRIPARLMLHMVVTPADNEMRLGPNDLTANLKSTGFETFGHNDGLCAGVPNIS